MIKINRVVTPYLYEVDKVKNQWLEKNVDLNMLTERIRPFFHEVDFETTVEKIQEGYMIQAVSKIPNLMLRINVTILGQPNNFTVEFSAGSGGYFSRSMIAGYLTTMFGGGYLISSEARKRETLDMLEKDFWRHTQIQVADLVDSATHVESRSKTSTS